MTKDKSPSSDHQAVDKQRLKQVLARTIPDETLKIASAADLVRTVEESEAHSQEQHKRVTQILLETLEDEAMGNKGLDFNISLLQESTRSESEINGLPNKDALKQRLNDHTIPGRYDIRGLLGSGATGQVFDVHDNNFDRDIAVKFMHPDDAHNQRKLLRFIDEASITAALSHPNILPVHDLDYTDGAMIYYTMGRANGSSLEELIQSNETGTVANEIADLNDRVRIILQASNAIAYAHSQGIVHNDIKPANIMVGQHGEVLVVDWGTATTAEQRKTDTGRMLGTPIYMSPEQARREPSDERSDIYCLGATLFHLLFLRFPCWHDNLDTFWENKRQGIYQKASEEERKRIPKALTAIIDKAMAADKDDRYPSVEAMILDLDAYLQGEAVSAHQDNIIDLIKRIYHKQPRVIYAALIGLMLIIFAGAWLYYEKALEQSRWITKHQFNFEETDLSSLGRHWQAYILPSWDVSKMKPVDISEFFTCNDGTLAFTKNIQHGALNLSLREDIPGNMRINWTYRAEHNHHNLNCFIGGNNRNTAYTFHVGGFGYTQKVTLTKNGDSLDVRALPKPITPGQDYHFEMEKTDIAVSLSINGREIINFVDPDMLIGNQHQHFGFDFMYATTHLDDIIVEYQPLPQKISPITVAHHYYSSALYQEALDHYEKIRETYPDTDMAITALYRIARSHSELGNTVEAAIRYKQFIGTHPKHPLFNHVILRYAVILARQRKFDDLKNFIVTHSLDQRQDFVKNSLLSSINSELLDYFRNQPISNSDKQFIYLPNRTQEQLRQDMITCLELKKTFNQLLNIKTNASNSNLDHEIATASLAYLNDTSVIDEYLSHNKKLKLLALLKKEDYQTIIKEYPNAKTSILLRAKNYDTLFSLDESELKAFFTHYEYGNIDSDLLDYVSKLLPEHRPVQSSLLLRDRKYSKVIEHYKDITRHYLYALDWEKRYHDMLKVFNNAEGTYALNWLHVRTLCKLKRFELAKHLTQGHGGSDYAAALVYESIYRSIKGEPNSFEEFLKHELLRINQIVRISRFYPFTQISQIGRDGVINTYKAVKKWNIDHGFADENSAIDFILGDISQEEYRLILNDHNPNSFAGDTQQTLLKAMRLELQGKKTEALKLYRTAAKTIDLDRELIAKWRIKALK